VAGGTFSRWALEPPVVEAETDVLIEDFAAASVTDQDFLGRGPAFPFYRGSSDVHVAAGAAAVKAAVAQILGTRANSTKAQGELPWRPEFGSKLSTLRHANMNDGLAELARHYIGEALATWEPRAVLKNVELEQQEQPGGHMAVVIRVQYSVITENVSSNQVEVVVNQNFVI
jgi:phage baseplate assembly protein W